MSGPEVYNPNVEMDTVNYPGALPGTKEVRLPKKLDEAKNQAQFAASVLEKMDHRLVEASTDLGANHIQTFIKVTFPLSLSGVVSGTIMTLLPSMTAFALPERLGGSKILLIGNIIEDYFMKTGNINGGSLISIFLMAIILMLFLLILRFDKEGETLI